MTLGLAKLDIYILKKFLATFFTSILLIMFVVIVFDVSEKIEDFLQPAVSLNAIVFDYYLNFIPYFINKFSALFVFISVIFFTSRLASRTEIVAMLSTGISFRRFLRPYIIGASLIAALSLFLNHYLIPVSNKTRMMFMDKYIDRNYNFTGRDIYRQVAPGVTAYMKSFDNQENTGTNFTLEKLVGQQLVFKMYAQEARWDSLKSKWTVINYWGRRISGKKEVLFRGSKLDTAINLSPKDFARAENQKESMTTGELRKFIVAEREKGSDNVRLYEIELDNRSAAPFSTFILTIIGVTVSSRKVRGGIGKHLGVGLALSFIYIFINQWFISYAQSGVMPSLIAVWIPNAVFSIVCIYLLRRAQK